MKPPEERKPVEDPAFWHRRIIDTVAKGGMLHQIVYNEQYEIWAYVQSETAGLLKRYLKPGQKVLDAGCGYGALVSCLSEARLIGPIQYYGIDISSELVEIARARYPEFYFRAEDLRHVTCRDGYFDWAVVRSMRSMILDNMGEEAWVEMRREIERVSKKQLYIEYESPTELMRFEVCSPDASECVPEMKLRKFKEALHRGASA